MNHIQNRYIMMGKEFNAGLGHLLTHHNVLFTLAIRHNLMAANGWPESSLYHRMKRQGRFWKRSLMRHVASGAHNNHCSNLSELYKPFLRLDQHLPSAQSLWHQIQAGELRAVSLPHLSPQGGPRDDLNSELEYAPADRVIEENPEPNTVFIAGDIEPGEGFYGFTMPWIAECFAQAHQPWPRNHGRRLVVLQIRRNDILNSSEHAHRVIADGYFVHIINQICKFGGCDAFDFVVLSDGDRKGRYVDETGAVADWSQHSDLPKRVSLRFATSLNWVDGLRLMRAADVLVTSKSGYSHLGALLNEGDTIALPFWHSFAGARGEVHLVDGAESALEETIAAILS